MALFEDMLKGAGGTGLAIGIGAVILAPLVLPVLGRVVKPAAKAALKTGISLYRETTNMTNELYQEAAAELAAGGGAAPEAATRATRAPRAER